MKATVFLMTMVFGVPAITEKTGDEKTPPKVPQAMVDFDAFEQLTKEVKEHRKSRLVVLADFLKMSKEENTVILDTRSDAMYNRKHIKGAIHLDFTEFTQSNLAKLIPSTTTRILIYCNNNFLGDRKNFADKVYMPPTALIGEQKPLTLALNIPTYINLYGYGYKNVFELSELVTIDEFMEEVTGGGRGLEFEGTAVLRKKES